MIFRITSGLLLTFFLFEALSAQYAFHDRRIINQHSTETLPQNTLDFRVSHRFGDLWGPAGGWPTFYGLENAADISIGFEYGILDDLDVGLFRTQGTGPLRQLVNGQAKWRMLNQFGARPAPLSVAIVGTLTASTQQASDDPTRLDFFEDAAHRLSYASELLISRRWSEYFSTQISGGYVHRNIVLPEDQNGIFFAGLSGRILFTKGFGLIWDTALPLSTYHTVENGFYPIMGLGFELSTGGGHVFQLNVTNARGLVVTDYIPYTQSDPREGELRLGFTISRNFRL